MNILLLNMPVILNKIENLEPPLGVAYIAAVLREKGHRIRIIDFEVEKFSESMLSSVLNDFLPNIVGISCRTASYNSAGYIVKLIKKINSNIFIVIGGHHVTAFPENSIKDTGCDAVVRGEGEITMEELITAFAKGKDLSKINGLSYKNGSVIQHNPSRELIENLDTLPFPARDLLPLRKYIVNSIITSRGCPFSCIYCDKSISTQNVRCRSSENVYKEIASLKKEKENKLIYFVDDFFFLKRQRVLEIFDLLKTHGHKIKWRCQSRVSPLDLSLLLRAKECGCELIIFGIETGDPEELIFIKKKSTLEDVEKAVIATKKAGISVRANFMLGFPMSTHKTIINTIKFAANLPLDICRFFIVVPFPNTVLWDYVVSHDLIKVKDIDWSKFDLYNTSYKIPNVSKYDLRCYAGAAYLYILKRAMFEEILLKGFNNVIILLKMIIRTRRIRGNISKTFPRLVNLVIELYFLTKNTSFFYKFKYLLNIIKMQKIFNID